MKIVIDIDESIFNDAKNGYVRLGEIADAVLSGTPLPNGHGRLIDADAFDKEIKRHIVSTNRCGNRLTSSQVANNDAILDCSDWLHKSLTIIEADKEAEND